MHIGIVFFQMIIVSVIVNAESDLVHVRVVRVEIYKITDCKFNLHSKCMELRLSFLGTIL